jgi:hypothetical protein
VSRAITILKQTGEDRERSMKFETTTLYDARSTERNGGNYLRDHPDTPKWKNASPDYVHIPDWIRHRGPRNFIGDAVWRTAVLAAPILVSLSIFTMFDPTIDPIMPYRIGFFMAFACGVALSAYLFQNVCNPIQSVRAAQRARMIEDQQITPADAQKTRELLEIFDRLGITYALDRAPEEMTNRELSQLAQTLNARAVAAQRCKAVRYHDS